MQYGSRGCTASHAWPTRFLSRRWHVRREPRSKNNWAVTVYVCHRNKDDNDDEDVNQETLTLGECHECTVFGVGAAQRLIGVIHSQSS